VIATLIDSLRQASGGSLSFAVGFALLAGLLAPRAKLTAALVFRDGSFEIERSQLEASKLQASLHGRDALGKLALDFRFALPDLAALAPALAGAAIVGVWYLVVGQLIDGQQARNAYLSTEIAKLDVQIKDIASLKAEIASLKARQKAVEDLQIDY